LTEYERQYTDVPHGAENSVPDNRNCHTFWAECLSGQILPDDSRKGGKDKTLAGKERCQYLMGNEFVTGKYLCLKYKNGQRFSRVVRR
ncbi:hypothetical protein ACTULP_005038, partial [Escherichia coli]